MRNFLVFLWTSSVAKDSFGLIYDKEDKEKFLANARNISILYPEFPILTDMTKSVCNFPYIKRWISDELKILKKFEESKNDEEILEYFGIPKEKCDEINKISLFDCDKTLEDYFTKNENSRIRYSMLEQVKEEKQMDSYWKALQAMVTIDVCFKL